MTQARISDVVAYALVRPDAPAEAGEKKPRGKRDKGKPRSTQRPARVAQNEGN